MIARGAYGVVMEDESKHLCHKLVTKHQAFSFIRELYVIKQLHDVSGITEVIGIDRNLPNDKFIDDPWASFTMKRYKANLKEWMRNRDFDRLQVLKDIVMIVSQVHIRGYLHADIKLENIMVTHNDEVRLIDWGLSGPKGYARIWATTEMYRSESLIQDYSHDIYSLGVLAIELLLDSPTINKIDHQSCKNILYHSITDASLCDILLRMIHPHHLKRPTSLQLCDYFHIIRPSSPNLSPVAHLTSFTNMLDKYDIPQGQYPIVFSNYLLKYGNVNSLAGILGAIYRTSYPKQVRDLLDYQEVINFYNML